MERQVSVGIFRAEICGPPPEVIPNIPVKRNRNGPFDLNSDRNYRNLWHNGKHPKFRQIGIDSHTTPIFHTFFYVYTGETIMPPRVLASGPEHCGGNNKL